MATEEHVELDQILLIDDDPIQNLINSKLIKNLGLKTEVSSVLSAKKALEWLEENPSYEPRIVFLDINMPRTSGWEFLDLTKDMEQLNRAKVYMLTSSISPDDIKKAEAHEQVEQFLTKPLSLKVLRDTIEGNH